MTDPDLSGGATTSSDIYFDTPDMDTIGGRLSRARDATGMTPAELARRIGVKTSTLNAWESDRSEPRANKLTMLAGVLNVSLSWLLYGVGSAPEENTGVELVNVVTGHLEKMKRLREETAQVISRLESELERYRARI